MDKRNPVSEGRIAISERGVGEISDAEIERRAREIALGDGRLEPADADLQRAREALEVAGPPPPPEGIEAEPYDWGTPPTSSGTSAIRITPEDEENPSEMLIQEGLDDADHDLRVSTAPTQVEED